VQLGWGQLAHPGQGIDRRQVAQRDRVDHPDAGLGVGAEDGIEHLLAQRPEAAEVLHGRYAVAQAFDRAGKRARAHFG
jgi:hypothetical protein